MFFSFRESLLTNKTQNYPSNSDKNKNGVLNKPLKIERRNWLVREVNGFTTQLSNAELHLRIVL